MHFNEIIFKWEYISRSPALWMSGPFFLEFNYDVNDLLNF